MQARGLLQQAAQPPGLWVNVEGEPLHVPGEPQDLLEHGSSAGGDLMPRRYFQDETRAREEYGVLKANLDLEVSAPVFDSFHQKWAVEWQLKDKGI